MYRERGSLARRTKIKFQIRAVRVRLRGSEGADPSGAGATCRRRDESKQRFQMGSRGGCLALFVAH